MKNSFSRTHNCGELNSSNIGQRVLLCGWLEFQRLDSFAILRDGYGSTQIIVPEKVRFLLYFFFLILNSNFMYSCVLWIFINTSIYYLFISPFYFFCHFFLIKLLQVANSD